MTLVVVYIFFIHRSNHYTKKLTSQFFRRNRNRVALNSFLADKLWTHNFGGGILFTSVKRKVKCNSTDVSKDVHTGRTQDKVDTKIIVNMKNCLLSGCRNVAVKIVHTDVISMLLFIISLYEIKVDFNFEKDRWLYRINNVCSRITLEQQLTLLPCYCLPYDNLIFFLTYQRVIGEMRGARTWTSLELSLN